MTHKRNQFIVTERGMKRPSKSVRYYTETFVKGLPQRYVGHWYVRRRGKTFLTRLFQIVHFHHGHWSPHRERWVLAAKRLDMKKRHMEYVF